MTKAGTVMMLFKACQRCAGDLRETSDIDGRYMQCIQCGNVMDALPTETVAVPEPIDIMVDDQPAAAA